MAQRFSEINDSIKEFIGQQKIYFVGTAASDGRVNVSPKGMDSFRVAGKNKVIWLNLTGSGNETAAHLLENSRMTIMFCSFDEKPMILRLYGNAKAHHINDDNWHKLICLFPQIAGSRQIIEMDVDLVQTSCGFAVPRYDFVNERETLKQWAEKKGDEGIKKYWKENNMVSLDGKPTNIMKLNTK